MNIAPNDHPDIFVAECPLGRGIFAGRAYGQNELLFRLSGPVITLSEAIKKGDAEGNALQIGHGVYLDLQAPGVFGNHSCDPNAGIRGALDVYALRPIRKGEEICYDYSTTMSEGRWTMTCRCGADSCRGVVGDFHDLPPELKQRYLKMKIVQPFIVHGLESAALSARKEEKFSVPQPGVLLPREATQKATAPRYAPC